MMLKLIDWVQNLLKKNPKRPSCRLLRPVGLLYHTVLPAFSSVSFDIGTASADRYGKFDGCHFPGDSPLL